MIKELEEAGVEIRACERSRKIVSHVKAATPEDWDAEYLDLILAVKIVDGVEEAIEHINTHGTGHSEAIVSQDYSNVRRFMAAVDAVQFMPMPLPVLPMVTFLALVRKWGLAPRSFTLVVLWACRN